MLILTRRTGEAVVIVQRRVRLQILGVNGNVVRIGFEADKTVPIHREEIYERIRKKPEPE